MKKLTRKIIPDGHSLEDFKCFGPAATKDGEFDKCMICDMGCFKQDNSDTNKYYHAAVVQSKINSEWYVYLEWGKVGGATDFQFYECSNQSEAVSCFIKQLRSKNDKRGEWYDDAVLGRILRAKKGKDCYLVRPQAVRSTGLPDAKTIAEKVSKVVTTSNKTYAPEVASLLQDLNVGTLEYTRSSMSSNAIPTVEAINEARLICGEALKGKNIEDLTSMLYSRIPKIKRRGEDYLLSGNNIKSWLDDLDAYEDAFNSLEGTSVIPDYPFELEYVTRDSKLGKFIVGYIKRATANRHGWCSGDMNIKNMWKIHREDSKRIIPHQENIIKEKRKITEKPFHIKGDFSRFDVEKAEQQRYNSTNTHLMFHGTRTVNVGGILKSTLKLPKELKGVSINGAMFGGGLYWADDWKKSAGYCSLNGAYWARGSGSINNREAFMFLCDVVLGEPFVAPYAKGYSKAPDGYDCVFGKTGVSGVANNEFITYETNSNNLRYLVEFNV